MAFSLEASMLTDRWHELWSVSDERARVMSKCRTVS